MVAIDQKEVLFTKEISKIISNMERVVKKCLISPFSKESFTKVQNKEKANTNIVMVPNTLDHLSQTYFMDMELLLGLMARYIQGNGSQIKSMEPANSVGLMAESMKDSLIMV